MTVMTLLNVTGGVLLLVLALLVLLALVVFSPAARLLR